MDQRAGCWIETGIEAFLFRPPVGAIALPLDANLAGLGRPMKKRSRVLIAGVSVLAAALLVRCSLLGHSSKSGQPPGLVAGSLAPCPDKPNCVCSELSEDAAHQIAPLDISGIPPEKAWSDLRQIIEQLGGKVVVANDAYLAATFSSALFGFVDDVECRLDASRNRIQIRSASRVGHSDLGVNRKRVEAITRALDQKLNGS